MDHVLEERGRHRPISWDNRDRKERRCAPVSQRDISMHFAVYYILHGESQARPYPARCFAPPNTMRDLRLHAISSLAHRVVQLFHRTTPYHSPVRYSGRLYACCSAERTISRVRSARSSGLSRNGATSSTILAKFNLAILSAIISRQFSAVTCGPFQPV